MTPSTLLPEVPLPLPFSRVRALVLAEICPSTGSFVDILRLSIRAIFSAVGECCFVVPRVDLLLGVVLLPAWSPPSLSPLRPLSVHRPPLHRGRGFPRAQGPRVNTHSSLGVLISRCYPSWLRREQVDSGAPAALTGQRILPPVTFPGGPSGGANLSTTSYSGGRNCASRDQLNQTRQP